MAEHLPPLAMLSRGGLCHGEPIPRSARQKSHLEKQACRRDCGPRRRACSPHIVGGAAASAPSGAFPANTMKALYGVSVRAYPHNYQ